MSTPGLTPVSYVVLGLLARDGASTPYELKQAVERGIAFLWPFPHSQLYSEPQQLAELGLVEEEREEGGRRRRRYRITDAGLDALRAWVGEPTDEPPQLRSLAILKLFFAGSASPKDVRALADAQCAGLERRIEDALAREERLSGRRDRAWQLEVLRGAAEFYRQHAGWWRRVGEQAGARASRRR